MQAILGEAEILNLEAPLGSADMQAILGEAAILNWEAAIDSARMQAILRLGSNSSTEWQPSVALQTCRTFLDGQLS
jgi:hypothetical protein